MFVMGTTLISSRGICVKKIYRLLDCKGFENVIDLSVLIIVSINNGRSPMVSDA